MNKTELNKDEIIKYLDITPPFLMIDFVKKLTPGKKCHAIKKLSKNDWFFECHLKKEQVMPGTLLIESMLQTLVLTIYTLEDHQNKISFIRNIESKIINKVSPENELEIMAELISNNRGIMSGKSEIYVKKILVCKGEFAFVSPHEMITPKNYVK